MDSLAEKNERKYHDVLKFKLIFPLWSEGFRGKDQWLPPQQGSRKEIELASSICTAACCMALIDKAPFDSLNNPKG